MNALKDFQSHFKMSNVVTQLIYINVGVFIITSLISVFSGLQRDSSNFLFEWFSLYSNLDEFITKPWGIVTYGFLHGGFLHILFNMLWLYFFGRLTMDYFSNKQIWNFYIFGTIFGGLLFMLSMNYFPLFEEGRFVLVGASAGVAAIIVGTATYIPNFQVRLMLINVYVKLWHIAAVFVLLDLISLDGGNAGGSFSHLGGALFGYLYVRQAKNSSSKKSSSSSSIFDFFKKKEKPLRTVHKSKNKRTRSATKNTKSDTQQRIDEILDKISKSGYDTLTKEEKEFLFKQRK
jgi:membrane associated rhomboid family serine protease